MFTNKVVLITGASSGLGAQAAQDFAEQGASVVITGRNKDNLEKVAKDCEDKSPKTANHLVIVADVTKESDVENIIRTTIERYNKLDVLINNAGILGFGSIENTSLEQYDKIMTTNVRASYHLTMLATPYLIESKGNIINVSSLSGLRSFPNILSYCVSKAALDQFTKCVALELGPKGVRVNAVNPGVIDTGIHLRAGMEQSDYEVYYKRCAELQPIGRAGTSKEVSSTIVFLASDAASNITGATLPVDGGRHAMCPR